MTKITQFNKPACRALSEDALKALVAVAAEHGVKIEYRGGTFLDTSFTFKFEAIIEGGATQRQQRQKADFEMNAPFIGMKPEDFGRELTINGIKMKIAGFKSRAPKRPIVCDGADGKTYGVPVEMVKHALASAS